MFQEFDSAKPPKSMISNNARRFPPQWWITEILTFVSPSILEPQWPQIFLPCAEKTQRNVRVLPRKSRILLPFPEGTLQRWLFIAGTDSVILNGHILLISSKIGEKHLTISFAVLNSLCLPSMHFKVIEKNKWFLHYDFCISIGLTEKAISSSEIFPI